MVFDDSVVLVKYTEEKTAGGRGRIEAGTVVSTDAEFDNLGISEFTVQFPRM